MSYALQKVGFDLVPQGRESGQNKIIAYKVLKNLGLKKFRITLPGALLNVAAAVVDARFGVCDFPFGMKKTV
jgi:hypothetical protein